jgi:hypothetical protein
MQFGQWLKLQEMPIKAMNFLPPENWPEIHGGKTKPGYGYDKRDRAILGSEAGRAKIIARWNNTHQDFVFYFARSPVAMKHQEVGEVTETWVKENLGLDIQPVEGQVTVIFTTNIGGEKIPMTAWMLAHRLGHAIKKTRGWSEFSGNLQRELTYLVQDVYGKQLTRTSYRNPHDPKDNDQYFFTGADSNRTMKHVANSIGTMASARKGKIFNFREFEFELLAQYLLTGKITFNNLKQTLVKSAFGNSGIYLRKYGEELNDYNEILQGIARGCEYHLDWAAGDLEGRIFVM